MAAFEYEALDPTGKRVKGVISADSPRLARRDLRAKKLVPLTLAQAARSQRASADANAKWWDQLPILRPSVGSRDLSLVTRQLATLVNASAPVEEALQAIALQAEKPGVRTTLLSVRAGVTEGLKLSQAMGAQSHVFDPLYRSMVAAGESSGTLGPVLERLADHLEKGQAMRAKVTAALVYPAFLAITALGIVIMLMTFVVPKVVDQFDSMGRDLPRLTEILIALSDGVRDYGLYAAIALGLGIIAFVRALQAPGFRRRVDGAMLHLPIIGRLMRELQAARLARTLASLIASGTPVLEGLTAARGTVSNTVMKDAIGEVVTQVREGTSLSAALRRAKAFPPLVVYMAAMGEKSGQLDTMLVKAADYMEAEFEAVTGTVLGLLEPAIIILMGAVVGTIIMAILLPILQFNSGALL